MKFEAKLSFCLAALGDAEICEETTRLTEVEKQLSDMYSIPQKDIEVIESPSICEERYISAKIISDNEFTALAALEYLPHFFFNYRLMEKKIEFKRIKEVSLL